jgi:squalene cyclase
LVAVVGSGMTGPTRDATERAISACLGYITSRQRKDGSWVDWKLPTGESDAWTTAYVGSKLAFLPDHLKGRAEEATRSAAGWLRRNVYEDGGWGYNREVGSDADSTSFSIIFLESAGEEVPSASRELLASHQREDGGFSTYTARSPRDSWGASHPDVTPVALMALLGRGGGGAALDRGTEYVLKSRTAGGWWNSFWWASSLYGTEANISFLNAFRPKWDWGITLECLLETKTWNSFETALLASSLSQLPFGTKEMEVSELVEELILTQQDDGSWPSAPVLRVTRRDCFDPWNREDSGPLFPDPRRLFTSSTVLEALCRANAFLP